MCGRYTLKTPNPRLRDLFGLDHLPHLVPRFNIAPTQSVLTVRLAESAASLREAVLMRWGLVPFWAKDLAIGNRMINARAETVAEKPAFRQAFVKRRCLIPADGFFEWEKLATGKKQPWWIRMKDEEPFAMAGLWETWSPRSESTAVDEEDDSDSPSQKSNVVQSCSILTIDANEDMQSLHDRMPVILPIESWAAWLSPASNKDQLKTLLKPLANGLLMRSRVSTIVNRPTMDSPECIAGLDSPEAG